MAYKPGVDDVRNSPSFEIIGELMKAGAEVTTYDPYIDNPLSPDSLDEAVDEAQAIIIATAHELFKDMVPEELLAKGIKVVVDGRNCLSKEQFINAGIVYVGIGR